MIMNNKNGFTLIELLAVIAVIAMISLIAIPNIVGLQDGIRKDQMLDDAKKLISMAKYKVNTDYDVRNFSKNSGGITCNSSQKSCEMSFQALNTSGDIKQDPDSTDGDNYISGYVRYSNSGVVKYCVYLEGSRRKVCNKKNCSSNDCVEEDNLYSRSNVNDK